MTTQPAYTARKATDDDISQKCPYAGSAFQSDDELAICLSCQSKLLRASWVENKGCTSYGCENAPDFRKDIPQEQTISLRDRRLNSEHEGLVRAFEDHDKINVRPGGNNLPEKYEIDFHVNGLERTMNGELVTRTLHTIEVVLPSDFPRRPPVCKMKTPIFHPNIDVWDICTSDHWAAQETIVDLVVRIGQMITYQTHNTKSPLNAEAAMWCDENVSRLPVDSTDIHPPEPVDPKALLSDAFTAARKHISLLYTSSTIVEAKDNIVKANHALAIDIGFIPNVGVQLTREKKELQEQLSELSNSLSAIKDLVQNQKLIEMHNVACAFLKIFEHEVASIIQTFAELNSPAWILSGDLSMRVVIKLVESVENLNNEIEKSIKIVNNRNSLAERGGLVVPELPKELNNVFANEVNLDCAVCTDIISDLVEPTNVQLKTLEKLLKTLGELIDNYEEYEKFNKILVQLESLEREIRDCPDSVKITIGYEVMIIRVGLNVLLGTDKFVCCQLNSRTGNVYLSDNKGKTIVEFRSSKSKLNDVQEIFPGITARLNSKTSKHIYEKSDLLKCELDELAESLRPKVHSAIKMPEWMSKWSAPVTREKKCIAFDRVQKLQVKAKDIFKENRIRTVMLKINGCLSRGRDIYSSIEKIQSFIKNATFKIDKISKKGNILKNGILRLPITLIDDFDDLNNKITSAKNKEIAYKEKLKVVTDLVVKLKIKLNSCSQPTQEHLSSNMLESQLVDLNLQLEEKTSRWTNLFC